jgi:two-component system nitrogen regulation sensor histidine kinase NtrY
VDREQIKRAMINLLENAMDAVEGNGEIAVDLSVDQDLQIIKIEVSDTGKGIPPEYKSRVFEPYFSTKKHGTGLGLAIVNTIISDHNGSIRVEDMRPKGTKFVIELPARD